MAGSRRPSVPGAVAGPGQRPGGQHGAEGPTPRSNPFADRSSTTRVLAIASGKGGVGKSSVTVNLAVTLARSGHSVGVLDADVYGFSVPKMLGVASAPTMEGDLLVPPVAYGVRCMSMGFFVPDDQAVIWRGPMLHKALEQFLVDVDWGEPGVPAHRPPARDGRRLDVDRPVRPPRRAVRRHDAPAGRRAGRPASGRARPPAAAAHPGRHREHVVVHRRRRPALRALRLGGRRPARRRARRGPARRAPSRAGAAGGRRHRQADRRERARRAMSPSASGASPGGSSISARRGSTAPSCRCGDAGSSYPSGVKRADEPPAMAAAGGEAAGGGESGPLSPRARQWAATMEGHTGPAGVRFAHGDSSARLEPAGAVGPRGEGGGRGGVALAGSDPGNGRRAAGAGGGARPVADVLRAGPRPDAPQPRLPPAGGQDAGLRLPRRPPADAPHPCSRGCPGGDRHREGVQAERRSRRGDRPRARLRARPGRPCERGRPLAFPGRRLRPRRLGSRLHRRPAQPVRRDSRRDPEPLVVSPCARHPRGGGRLSRRPHRLHRPRPRGRRPRRRRR